LITALSVGLPPLIESSYNQGLLPAIPSFLFETTWFIGFTTTVIFVYLYRSKNPSFFVQLYLLSMAVKLMAYFGFALFMILEDRQGAVPNVLYFLAIYFLFTAIEIVFLYRRISGMPRP
jgi:hypothetical protein